MELYFQFIFLLAFVKYALKASMNTKIWILLLYPLVAAVFAYLIYPWMIQQRGDSFTAILADKGLVADCAVLITIEAVIGIVSSIYILDNYFAPKTERKRSIFVLKVFPGILFFIGIAYFELAFFKQFVGMPFNQTALLYSGAVFACVTAMAFLLRWLMQGESLKLEAKITINLFILAIALFVNSTLTAYNTSHSQNEVEWLPSLTAILIFVLFASIGLWIYKHQDKIKALFYRKRNKEIKNS